MMTDTGEAWDWAGPRLPARTQLLPLPDAIHGPDRSLTHWEYLAIARAFRKWYKRKGYKDSMPVEAYGNWCKAANLPHIDTDGMLELPGYASY
jgi:hypothetical protein